MCNLSSIKLISIFLISLLINITYIDGGTRRKSPMYDPKIAKEFINEKTVSLTKTIIDLDFPESDKYFHFKRLVQFIMDGEVNDVQLRYYRNVKLTLQSGSYYTGPKYKNCSQDVEARVCKCLIDHNTHEYTIVYYGQPIRGVIKPNTTLTFEFFGVLNTEVGLNMKNFWVEFNFSKRCMKDLYVNLLEPNNFVDSSFQNRTN